MKPPLKGRVSIKKTPMLYQQRITFHTLWKGDVTYIVVNKEKYKQKEVKLLLPLALTCKARSYLLCK